MNIVYLFYYFVYSIIYYKYLIITYYIIKCYYQILYILKIKTIINTKIGIYFKRIILCYKMLVIFIIY